MSEEQGIPPDQAKLAEALKKLDEKLQFVKTVIDKAPDIVLQLDKFGFIRDVNPALERMLGYTPIEIIGVHFAKLPFMATSSLARCTAEFAFNVTGRERPPFEATMIHRDGRRITIEANARFIVHEGKFIGVTAIIRDITAHKKLEADLAEARDAALESARIKAEFLANMSHEIRTPMNAIIGMTDLLLDTPLNRDQRDYAETVRGSGDALLQIINDVLDISKIEAGKLEFHEDAFDLRTTVEDAVALVAGKAQSKGLELAAYIPNDIQTSLIGDSGRVRQIILNFVSNAVKFTEHGEVFLKVTLENDSPKDLRVRFDVVDSGIGISEKDQQRLFQSFSQVDSKSTRKFGGTGLGLAISKKLVEGMGGQIGVTSKRGEGSTFWFTLGFKKQKAKTKPVKIPAEIKNARVLAVDDHPLNLLILRQQLETWGISADSATSGPDALQKLAKAKEEGNPFTLVIMDMFMPGMTGIETAETMRRDPALTGTRIVLLSAMTQPLSEEMLKNAGVSAQLTKPLKQSRFFDCLSNVMTDQLFAFSEFMPSSIGLDATQKRSHVRVLVVDDNPVNQKLTMLQLNKLGIEADVVGNGAEALKQAAMFPYSAILMDCQMPEMDGFAATAEIRVIENGKRHTPVIGLTANALSGDREKCLAAGMDDYLSKPVKIQDLAAMIQKWDVPVDPGTQQNVKNAVKEFYPELVGIFIRSSMEDLTKLKEAFRERDLEQVKRMAHKMKGGGGNVGSRGMQIICHRIDTIADEQNWETIGAAVDALEKERERVVSALQPAPPRTGTDG